MSIAPAHAHDLGDIRALLDAAGLPSADIEATRLKRLLVVRDRQALAGVVGLENHAGAGLLRSLVVAPAQRGAGLGTQLVAAAEALARACAIREVFLPTTTAQVFFARLGYAQVPRESAPAALRSTAEFAALCPASAICMRKTP